MRWNVRDRNLATDPQRRNTTATSRSTDSDGDTHKNGQTNTHEIHTGTVTHDKTWKQQTSRSRGKNDKERKKIRFSGSATMIHFELPFDSSLDSKKRWDQQAMRTAAAVMDHSKRRRIGNEGQSILASGNLIRNRDHDDSNATSICSTPLESTLLHYTTLHSNPLHFTSYHLHSSTSIHSFIQSLPRITRLMSRTDPISQSGRNWTNNELTMNRQAMIDRVWRSYRGERKREW